MREIKRLGTYQKEGISRAYCYSLFECSRCGKHVEKIRRDGLNAKSCSRHCYSQERTGRRYGPYKEKVLVSGYLYIYQPDHPRTKSGFYVAEHRLVAEKKIGRYLKENEVVHHINENKLDNRPENLQVMSNSEHMKMHAEMKRRNRLGEFTI